MIISKTPLRISFAGGGTDIDTYYKTGYGAVVNATINKYIYVTVHRRFDSSIRVSYTKTEIADRVEDIQHDIVRACLQMAGIKNGIEITTIGEVPGGTGLGSSSSLTVGLLNALFKYKGEPLSLDELLKRACEIEIDILGAPIGKQDQSAAVFGGINYFRFNADESIDRRQIVLPELTCAEFESKLMLMYTGLQRNANFILKSQKRSMKANPENMDYMRDQADALYELLCADESRDKSLFDGFGSMLHEGWLRKRKITDGISNDDIDTIYEKALSAGAKGGKLLGAGNGGFLLLYCDEAHRQNVRDAVGLKELPFRFTKFGSRIVYFG